MQTKMEHHNPQTAFAAAIAAGTLSADHSAENFAGHYMYMCTVNGEHQFKHSLTRQYLKSLTPGFTAAKVTT